MIKYDIIYILQCRRPRFDSWVKEIPWRRHRLHTPVFLGFPGGPDSIDSACNVGNLGSIPRLGRSLARGARQATVQWGHKELDMTERLSIAQCNIHNIYYMMHNIYLYIHYIIHNIPACVCVCIISHNCN